MKILFAFENPLPSPQADAEVFLTTARHLAPLASRCWLHVPLPGEAVPAIAALAGMAVVRARAPLRPAALRHLCCGLTLPLRREFREADLVYTRNLWVAWVALLFGQRVAFDHYRPWPAQIPPLQFLIHRLLGHRRFLVNICHSDYTRERYRSIGVAEDRLRCVRNGFDPARLQAPVAAGEAKRLLGLDAGRPTVVYTGRLNHKKGLALVVEAARRLPDHLFLLVGSHGEGPIEAMARDVANIRVVGWQPAETLGRYIFAADVLLIPPSWKPLAEFGSTVLPLKLFLYMASGRPVLAGDTPDIREVLRHGANAVLCRPDDPEALVAGLGALARDPALAARLAAAAQDDSRNHTWNARAHTIADLLAARLPEARLPEARLPEARLPEARRHPAQARRVGWSRAQYAAWMRQSWRWLAHLVRARSWVLPPGPDSSFAPLPEAAIPRRLVPGAAGD
jgi:glycosyltransferase involved in cell wall biosynthesis